MASKRLFMPPLLENVDDFENCLHEIEIWQYVTDLEDKKQRPAMYLSLNEKIRKSCSSIQVKDLNNAEGVSILVKKLKSLYAKDIHQSAFIAYEKFENF